MSDLQFFKIVDVLDGVPTSDTLVNGERNVRLKVVGRASLVSEVTVNGYLSKGFTVVSEHVLIVVLPTQVYEMPLSSLSFLILSSGYTHGQGSYEILYDIGKVSPMISGSDVLVQRWIRFLLMSKGSDKKDVDAGVGLISLAGQATLANLHSIRVVVARKHHDCKRQIISRQTREMQRMRRSEILKDATLMGVSMDEDGRLIVESLLLDGANRAHSIGTRV